MPPHIVFGAGGIGSTPKSFTYTWDTAEKVNELLDALQDMGISELDCAAGYPPTNPRHAETLLGESQAAKKGFIIDTKVLPHKDRKEGGSGKTLDAANAVPSLDRSLELMGVDKVRTLYAHFHDKNTPIAEQAETFHNIHKSGKVESIGLCNYLPKDLEEYFRVCEEKGFTKPTIYQGNYNILTRNPEQQLIPLLRKHNCVFYAYSPLAGGFLTGKVTFTSDADKELHRTRWNGESAMTPYVIAYDLPKMHDAIRRIDAVCKAADPPVSIQDACLRWLMHHSALQEGDAVILGAKRIDQLQSNVEGIRGGPLSDDIVKVLDAAFASVDDPDMLF